MDIFFVLFFVLVFVGFVIFGVIDCIGILLDWLDEIFIEVWDKYGIFEVSLGVLFFVLKIFFLLFVFLFEEGVLRLILNIVDDICEL